MNFSVIFFFYYIDFAVIIGRYFFSCPCIFNDDISFNVFETINGTLELFSVQYTAMTVETFFKRKLFFFYLSLVCKPCSIIL